MNNKLKILILEDNPNDAELVKRQLTKDSIDCKTVLVESRDDFIAQLETFRPDLILSDYMLPQYTGMKALIDTQAHLPDTPFIIVTGSINEETAAYCIKAGAWDYVTKKHLARLGSAVRGCLDKKRAMEEKTNIEKELHDSEELLRITVENILDPVFITYDQCQFTFICPNVPHVLGFSVEEVSGMGNISILFGENIVDLKKLRTVGIIQNIEKMVVHKDRQEHIYLISIKKVSIKSGTILYVLHNITDRRNLEAQLLHSQKMEAVGQLAGGVAHDFNNILTAIINLGYLMKTKDADSLGKSIDQIVTLAFKAADITKGLLTFSRKSIINPVKLNLNDSVINMEKLLSKFIGEDIELIIRLSDENPILMADSAQLEQIIMNLSTNAKDAMPNGGYLTIETSIVKLDIDFTTNQGYENPGTYALLTVSDTGTGIGEETINRIFEPFYTTKEPGKGTGLGLSIIYGIVKQHSGNVTAYSEPGKGTTFKVYFMTADAAEVEEEKDIDVEDLRGNEETVLIAEDETLVRESEKLILEKHGYKVLEAIDGEDAIQKYRENKDDIRLLVLDVVMPKKNGKETLEEIRKITPGIKAIFTSGYTADVIDKKGTLEKNVDLIMKPALPVTLLSKVKEVLHSE